MDGEQLKKALEKSRANLEKLKTDYSEKRRACGEKDRETVMYLHEMIRVVNAIESIKNRLVLTGGEVPLSDLDIEHPDDACERLYNASVGPVQRTSGCLVVIVVIAMVLLVLLLLARARLGPFSG